MSTEIPAAYKDLLEEPVYVTLATIMPNGQPQLTVVWCSYDGTYVLVNTARGRQKERNMSARPQVSVMAIDPKNPYRWLEVRGVVEEITAEGGLDHINRLAKAYLKKSAYYGEVAPA